MTISGEDYAVESDQVQMNGCTAKRDEAYHKRF